ncbi:MAG: 50S ribosomal protein L19e [Nanoarchaeota archaeon]
MRLTSQRRVSAQLLKVGENKVWFDPERLQEVKEAITKADVRGLINNKVIQAKPDTGISGFRSKKIKTQKRKGRMQGPGSRKGSSRARLPRKTEWMAKVRAQRDFLKEIRASGLIDVATFRSMYLKIKGGFFRSRRHIKLYLNEHNLFKQKK